MPDLLVLLPLAQMNTSTGGGGTQSAAPVERSGAGTAGTGVTGEGAAPATGSAGGGGTVAGTQGAAAPTPPSSNPLGMILPIILMFGVLYLVLFRGQNKEKKRREALISDLKKGDRVMTIGGMLARVVSIDGDEVVLKVDESANVKATYRKSAIQEVIGGDDKK